MINVKLKLLPLTIQFLYANNLHTPLNLYILTLNNCYKPSYKNRI